MHARFFSIASLILSISGYGAAQAHSSAAQPLLRARELYVTASLHRDNCLVVSQDGSLHVELRDTKQSAKPEVYQTKLPPDQLEKVKKWVTDPELAKAPHKGTQAEAEGIRVQTFIVKVPHQPQIVFTQQDGNPEPPPSLKPLLGWIDDEFNSNLPEVKNARATGCGERLTVAQPK